MKKTVSPSLRESPAILSPNHDLASSGISAQRFETTGPPRRGDHIHELVEMTFLAEGELTNVIDGEPLNQGPGELVVIAMGSRHRLRFDRAVYYNLYLDPDRFPMELIPPDLTDSLLPLLVPSPGFSHKLNRIQKIRFDRPERLTYAFDRMTEERERKRPGWEGAMLNWGLIILTACARAAEKGEEGAFLNARGGLGRSHPVLAVCRHLDLYYDKPLDLPGLAALSGYEVHYLCRKFKEMTGLTPATYLHRRRIRQALHLLSTTRERITAVALACGYDDVGYFNRRFKRQMGVSPGEWRRMAEQKKIEETD